MCLCVRARVREREEREREREREREAHPEYFIDNAQWGGCSAAGGPGVAAGGRLRFMPAAAA